MPFLILALLALGASVYLAGEFATAPSRERRRGVSRASTYGRVRLSAGDDRQSFVERVLVPTGQKLARLVLRLSPKTSTEVIAAKLLSAGLSRSVSPTGFLAAKALFVGAGAFFGFVIGGFGGGPFGALFFAAVFAVGGWMFPDIAVSKKATSRREAARAELPDALDLLAVSVEAGLGFDAAMGKITEHMDGVLAQEFSLVLGEVRMGEARPEALKKLAERVQAPELASFVRAIVQADQLGISMGRILRVQAADTRLRRQAAAEERAMKAPVKMLFPTVLFIFPSMFIVILGPAILTFLTVFK